LNSDVNAERLVPQVPPQLGKELAIEGECDSIPSDRPEAHIPRDTDVRGAPWFVYRDGKVAHPYAELRVFVERFDVGREVIKSLISGEPQIENEVSNVGRDDVIGESIDRLG